MIVHARPGCLEMPDRGGPCRDGTAELRRGDDCEKHLLNVCADEQGRVLELNFGRAGGPHCVRKRIVALGPLFLRGVKPGVNEVQNTHTIGGIALDEGPRGNVRQLLAAG